MNCPYLFAFRSTRSSLPCRLGRAERNPTYESFYPLPSKQTDSPSGWQPLEPLLPPENAHLVAVWRSLPW